MINFEKRGLGRRLLRFSAAAQMNDAPPSLAQKTIMPSGGRERGGEYKKEKWRSGDEENGRGGGDWDND